MKLRNKSYLKHITNDTPEIVKENFTADSYEALYFTFIPFSWENINIYMYKNKNM